MNIFKQNKQDRQSNSTAIDQVLDPKLGGMVKLRLQQGLFFMLLIFGAVGGVTAFARSSQAEASVEDISTAVAASIEPPENVGVGGFGELYVSVWLSGNTAAVKPYYPEPVNDNNVGDRFWAAHTATVDVEQTDSEDYWRVTVAADVLERGGESSELTPVGVRFYVFGVLKIGDGYVATSLPSQVPAPPTLELPDQVIDQMQRPDGDLKAVAEATQGFLDALLAGSGDIERFISPDADITPIVPAPFTSVEIIRIGAKPDLADPQKMLVKTEIQATSSAGNTQLMQYTLIFKTRDDRWETFQLETATPLNKK